MPKSKKPMTKAAARRIQSANAKKNGGRVDKDSFASKAQSVAAKNDSREFQPDTSKMSKQELDTWSNINNPNNTSDMSSWSNIHNPNNDDYIGED